MGVSLRWRLLRWWWRTGFWKSTCFPFFLSLCPFSSTISTTTHKQQRTTTAHQPWRATSHKWPPPTEGDKHPPSSLSPLEQHRMTSIHHQHQQQSMWVKLTLPPHCHNTEQWPTHYLPTRHDNAWQRTTQQRVDNVTQQRHDHKQRYPAQWQHGPSQDDKQQWPRTITAWRRPRATPEDETDDSECTDLHVFNVYIY